MPTPLNPDADRDDETPESFENAPNGFEFSQEPANLDEIESSDLLRDWNAFENADSDEVTSRDKLYENLLQPWVFDDEGDLELTEEPSPDEVASTSDQQTNRKTNSPDFSTTPISYPGPNDEIYGFKLLRELGRGTFAQVFLARQGNLAFRLVVLKLSPIVGTEPQTLAQLQHTNVVPIYSVHEDKRWGLRVVCMPFLGGACLADVLKLVWQTNGASVTTQTLIDALDEASKPPPGKESQAHLSESDSAPIPAPPEIQPAQAAQNTLKNQSYVQATVSIVRQLAAGLHHSHERHILHRDIKPSNILISADSTPLLLDFNVAQSIGCKLDEATLGGTIAYMSPEQLQAALERTPESVARITPQSDVYSLGLVLYEMLTGTNPFGAAANSSAGQRRLEVILKQRKGPAPLLRQKLPFPIPPSLESIIRKSLTADPVQRYATAAQFAEDLDRFLNDLPLKYAPERNVRERFQKWKRRHPKLTTALYSTLFVCMFILLPGTLLFQLTHSDLQVKQQRLQIAEAKELARKFHSQAEYALCLVDTVIPNDETLEAGIVACEKTLANYHVITTPDWQDETQWQLLAPVERIDVAKQVRELLVVLGSAYLRAKPNDKTEVERALDLILRAQKIQNLPVSRALAVDQARYLTLLNRTSEAAAATAEAGRIPITDDHEKYMLGSALAREQSVRAFRDAIELLTQAIEGTPKHYWAFFKRALCYQSLGETTLAISDLGTCIGLNPTSSWAHFNHGYLMALNGHKHEAVADYTKAITFSPQFQSAYFNRGLTRLELRENAGALADFENAAELGRKDVVLAAGKAMALEGLGKHDESDQQFSQLMENPQFQLDPALERIAWTYAFAIAHRAPLRSLSIFDGILKLHPKHPQAHYGRGMLLMPDRKKLREAVQAFDAAISAAPKFMEPLRYRAVALARLGQIRQATVDVNTCLDVEPSNPDTLYIAACVAAISARGDKSDKLISDSIELLKRAIVFGVDRERAYTDPDFSALRHDPEFIRLTGPQDQIDGGKTTDSL